MTNSERQARIILATALKNVRELGYNVCVKPCTPPPRRDFGMPVDMESLILHPASVEYMLGMGTQLQVEQIVPGIRLSA